MPKKEDKPKAKKWWESNVSDLPEYGDGKKPPKKPKATPKEESAVSRFGKYVKGKAGEMGANYKAVDDYYKEKWKSKDLQEQVKKKKKLSKIARLKAEGRRLREKKNG